MMENMRWTAADANVGPSGAPMLMMLGSGAGKCETASGYAGVLAGKGLGLANVKRPAADAHDAGAWAGKCEAASS